MSRNGIARPDTPTSRDTREVSSDAREVVAGLVNDGSVAEVAATAVRMARELGARVRFVHVVPEGTTSEDRADLESGAFAVALAALHGRPQVGATFEYPSGDPGRLLVERSRDALGLVVGADDSHPYGTGREVARFCREHAGCRVLVVGARDRRLY